MRINYTANDTLSMEQHIRAYIKQAKRELLDRLPKVKIVQIEIEADGKWCVGLGFDQHGSYVPEYNKVRGFDLEDVCEEVLRRQGWQETNTSKKLIEAATTAIDHDDDPDDVSTSDTPPVVAGNKVAPY